MVACIPRRDEIQLRLPFDEDAEVWNHFVHNTYGIVEEAWGPMFIVYTEVPDGQTKKA
jgi:hypothetical protein